MALGLIELRGGDVFCTLEGGGKEARFALEGALPSLRDWAKRYDQATWTNDEATFLAIGQEMFVWLDNADWASAWADGTGHRQLDIRVDQRDDERAAVLLDAPWELLARDGVPLALDDLQLFVVARQVGEKGTAFAPAHRDLQLMFMAASPEGQKVLDFEAEEAAILDATRGNGRTHVVVEETGALDELARRLAGDERPFEAVHLSCHGSIHPENGPFLCLEDAAGALAAATPGDMAAAFGLEPPALVVLSACRTAERGADLATPYARRLAALIPNVVGWDGSVYDHDAIAFAATLYGELGNQRTVPWAVAMARRSLLRAKLQDPKNGRHWHLARVYLGPAGGEPLCAAGKPGRTRAADPTKRTYLDNESRRVPVATREQFVGRRRSIQKVLRAFNGGALGVLVHGMGALGKSSLAKRIADRLPLLKTVVIYERYDALAIFDELVKALPARTRSSERDAWRAQVKDDGNLLADALESWLDGPLADQPILLIVDDLERVLDTPAPGQPLTGVDRDHRDALGAVLRAFGATQSRSRLLFTSRYDFHLPNGSGGDLARDLVRVPLRPMPERDRMKQLRAAERLAGQDAQEDDATLQRLSRALTLASGNPGLQDVLTQPILAGEDGAADDAMEQIEAFQRDGVPPAAIQALIDQGAAKDTDNAIVAFFRRLSFKTYRDALTEAEQRQLAAATLFDAGVPIPLTALIAVGTAHGVDDPTAALLRLLALGLVDSWGELAGTPHAAANPLARPLAPQLEDPERPALAQAAMPALVQAWQDQETGHFEVDLTRGVQAARIALEARAEPPLVEQAVFSAGLWLARIEQRDKEALPLIEAAVAQWPADYAAGADFLRLGVEVADRLGAAQLQDALLARPIRPPASDAPEAQWDHAALDWRRALRLMRLGDIGQAETLTRDAQERFKAAGDERMVAVTAGQIADILFQQGELDQALAIREQDALPVYEALGDKRNIAVTWREIADIQAQRGELENALAGYRRACDLVEPLGAVRDLAVFKGKIADILVMKGELDQARAIRERDVLPVYDALGDKRNIAIAKGKIADILFQQGELDQARAIHERDQLPIFEALGDQRAIAITKGRIADILFQQGELDQALTLQLECLPIHADMNDIDGIAKNRFECAQIRLKRGGLEGDEAQTIADELGEAWQLSRRITNALAIAQVGSLYGQVLAMGGYPQAGIEVLEIAAAAWDKLGHTAHADECRELIAAIRHQMS